MDFVRTVDWDRAEVDLPGGYKGQYLYSGESCFIIATKVPPGSGGPSRHVHASDQSYFVLGGEISLSLGHDDLRVPTGSAVFIPAGVPHQNWNRGDVDEVHLEVIAPGISPIEPVLRATEEIGDASHRGFVAASDPTRRGGGEFIQDWVIDRARGAERAGIYFAEVPPHKAGPPLHVHEFDQFYFVLSGVLSVEIGLSRMDVGPDNLIVLPAQVPHRQWNEQDEVEHHLTILAPEPLIPHSVEQPWDVAVALSATGVRID
jgi:mannose-6-phosphate isomerase-like protein (cupin superfamily)